MPIIAPLLRTVLLLVFFFISALPAFSQDNYKQVLAKEGDGIFTLLRRYGLEPAEHLKTFVEINKANLGKNNSLYIGRSYSLPMPASAGDEQTASNSKAPVATPTSSSGSSRIINMPLFGPKYARVVVKDQKLKGAVYYLSSGHGGADPGAVGKYGTHLLAEDEYAYDVTIRLARKLMEHGATVYMIVQDPDDGIRDEHVLKLDKDEIIYPNIPMPLSQKERLRQRVNAVNKLYGQHKGAYQRMLAIHVDSRSQSQNIDVFFYHHEKSKEGSQLAKNIHQTFTSKYKRYQPNRDYFGSVSQRSSLYVIKYSHAPTVFIELGNIKNDKDQRRFVIPDNRQALANWISEGLISDYSAQK